MRTSFLLAPGDHLGYPFHHLFGVAIIQIGFIPQVPKNDSLVATEMADDLAHLILEVFQGRSVVALAEVRLGETENGRDGHTIFVGPSCPLLHCLDVIVGIGSTTWPPAY